MKTAICIDSLISRDETTILIELALNLFPESEIYTIAHKRGGILGRIEMRPIISSFLSHKAKDQTVFAKNFWILPSAVKGIHFHPSIQKVIVFSRGYIHGLVFPANLEGHLYIIDWNLVDQEKLGWQKLFSSYVNQWRDKALTKFKNISVSSEELKRNLYLPNAEVIQPTFRTEEYPFVKDDQHNFLFTHHLILTQDIQEQEIRSLINFLVSKNESVKVIGPDMHLEKLKVDFPQVEFVGDHCESTTAYYSHQAKVIWDFSRLYFPARALGALCTGRPVVVRDSGVYREYLSEGAFFIKELSNEGFGQTYEMIESSYLRFDRKVLRRLGLKWNERLFKSRMGQFLSK